MTGTASISARWAATAGPTRRESRSTASTSSRAGNLKGGFIRGTLGYNYAPLGSSWLFGIEVDGAWASIRNSASGTVLGTTLAVEDKINAIGSVTGRLGWTFGPGLLYAKGGWAWADQRLSATLVTPLAVADRFADEFPFGLDGRRRPRIPVHPQLVRQDRIHVRRPGTTTFGNGTLLAGGVGVGHTLHTIKGGINYHFNWGGPVVARY